jgi:hypothetical protein
MGKRFSNPITVQGVESDDGRLFAEFLFRDLPLTLRWTRRDEGAHHGAEDVGVLSAVREATDDEKAAVAERVGTPLPDDAVLWWGDGEYADLPAAQEAEALADLGAQFISVDPGGKLEYHWEILDPAGAVVSPAEVDIAYEKVYFGTDDADEAKVWLESLRERTVFDLYEVGAMTQVGIPCFPQCRVALVGEAAEVPALVPAARDNGTDRTDAATTRARVLLRRLAAGPATRPAAWYAQQDLDGYTKFTISDKGQISGHLGAWNACHEPLCDPDLPNRVPRLPPGRGGAGRRHSHAGRAGHDGRGPPGLDRGVHADHGGPGLSVGHRAPVRRRLRHPDVRVGAPRRDPRADHPGAGVGAVGRLA